MIKVGITGGIGSGKSIICKVFEKLGVKVYNADDRAKVLMDNSMSIKKQLMDRFGFEVYKDDHLNRPFLANIIFRDKLALIYVNSVVHPEVAKDFDMWCSNYENDKYVIKEAALLFESGSYKQMDKMITVYAPVELRLERVMSRDNISQEQVLSRMNNQLLDDEKIKLSDFLIYNDDKISVLEQVLKLHHELSKL